MIVIATTLIIHGIPAFNRCLYGSIIISRKVKENLNFSEFGKYAIRKQYRKLEEINEEVEEQHMPLSSYSLASPQFKTIYGTKRIAIELGGYSYRQY